MSVKEREQEASLKMTLMEEDHGSSYQSAVEKTSSSKGATATIKDVFDPGGCFSRSTSLDIIMRKMHSFRHDLEQELFQGRNV